MRVAMPDETVVGFASALILSSRPHLHHDDVLLTQILASTALEGHVPVFTTPRNGTTQLYP